MVFIVWFTIIWLSTSALFTVLITLMVEEFWYYGIGPQITIIVIAVSAVCVMFALAYSGYLDYVTEVSEAIRGQGFGGSR